MNPGNHPTGIAGALTAVILLVLRQFFHVDIDADTAIAFGGVVTGIVSLITPRVTHITSIVFTPEKDES